MTDPTSPTVTDDGSQPVDRETPTPDPSPTATRDGAHSDAQPRGADGGPTPVNGL